ncbi:nuclear receptor-interacting protein 3 [Pelodytes ibericus]
MFFSGIVTDGSRKEADLRESPSHHQQRRMKQSVQFIHKDSADLLPLDGLKRLGTSKDTQPHNILHRRLLESNVSKLRTSRPTWSPKNEFTTPNNKKSEKRNEEEDLIFVWCQCSGKRIKALIDTACQYNLLSSAFLDRLGLKEHFRLYNNEEERFSLPYNVKSLGQIESLAVTLGGVALECSAVVIDDNERYFSLGLQTLRSIKCAINLEKNQLEVRGTEQEVIPFTAKDEQKKETQLNGSGQIAAPSSQYVDTRTAPLAAEDCKSHAAQPPVGVGVRS